MATPLRAEINGDIAFETVIKLHKKNLNKTIQGQGLCLGHFHRGSGTKGRLQSAFPTRHPRSSWQDKETSFKTF